MTVVLMTGLAGVDSNSSDASLVPSKKASPRLPANALASIGIELPLTPCPMNLWENSRVMPDYTQVIEPPVSKPGDHVTFRAEMDIAIVFSCCPQDMVPTNGADGIPTDAHFEIR